MVNKQKVLDIIYWIIAFIPLAIFGYMIGIHIMS